MLPIEVARGIYWIGTNDRITELFEGMWPIKQEGISYNSYLVKDQKSAVIDLSSKAFAIDFVEHISNLIPLSSLNYVVINHMEPDHSGALRALRMAAPQVVIVGTQKTRDMLASFYNITENVMVVADGQEISLGEHTLRFLSTPFLHWPETMMTFEVSSRALFSCDAFGGYGALNGSIFDDGTDRQAWYETQSLRYYSNILPTFSKPVKTAAAKLKNVDIGIIAPSHGLVWRKSPGRIVELYQKWADYAGNPGDPAVTLIYATIYGNTERMMEVVAQGVADENLPVTIFNSTLTSPSYILPELWTKQGVLVGSPTYEGGLYPSMGSLLEMASIKHISNRSTARFGSFAWNGGADKEFAAYAEKLHWQTFGDLNFSGSPKADELIRGREFGAAFARQVKEATAKKV
jgi:flavorubredoxin